VLRFIKKYHRRTLPVNFKEGSSAIPQQSTKGQVFRKKYVAGNQQRDRSLEKNMLLEPDGG